MSVLHTCSFDVVLMLRATRALSGRVARYSQFWRRCVLVLLAPAEQRVSARLTHRASRRYRAEDEDGDDDEQQTVDLCVSLMTGARWARAAIDPRGARARARVCVWSVIDSKGVSSLWTNIIRYSSFSCSWLTHSWNINTRYNVILKISFRCKTDKHKERSN